MNNKFRLDYFSSIGGLRKQKTTTLKVSTLKICNLKPLPTNQVRTLADTRDPLKIPEGEKLTHRSSNFITFCVVVIPENLNKIG